MNSRIMDVSPYPPAPPLPINLDPSSTLDQAPLSAGSPQGVWTQCSTTVLVSVALLVPSEVEPLPCPVLLGLTTCPAAHDSLPD